jgi:hypothetical protein
VHTHTRDTHPPTHGQKRKRQKQSTYAICQRFDMVNCQWGWKSLLSHRELSSGTVGEPRTKKENMCLPPCCNVQVQSGIQNMLYSEIRRLCFTSARVSYSKLSNVWFALFPDGSLSLLSRLLVRMRRPGRAKDQAKRTEHKRTIPRSLIVPQIRFYQTQRV